MHVFPQLRELEQRYPAELAVVGVHSPKFPAEKETANVRKAVLRYEVEHPVVNDADFRIWQEYGCRAWPTLMFLDPEGRVVGKHEGEISMGVFDGLMKQMIAEFDEEGLLDRRPLKFKLEREKEWERPLSFPGKLLADNESDRLFITDSNHNRVLVCSLDGHVADCIGSGEKTFEDGSFADAALNDPQGMALDGQTLYIADTKNHAVRRADLSGRRLETVAGTGEQAPMFHAGGPGLSTTLNSPWDLALVDGVLYIAMAGFHQLWRLDLDTSEVRPHAGSGRERIVDGPLDFAQLAQPSGIVSDGTRLYFTDSETSAVRTADLAETGRVSTIVGEDLFTFGDVDGLGNQVRLQHPLGIDIRDGELFITDTYNNKIKRILPVTRSTTTFLGSGETGSQDGTGTSAQFHEPGGLSIANGRMYIADTNNHAIRVADLESRLVTTLEITGL